MEDQQEYLVLTQIGGAGDPEIWRPGSKIRLTAKAAAAHLASANVRAIETTQPLPMEPGATIYTAEEPEPPTRRRRTKVEVGGESTAEVEGELTTEVDAWQR